MRWEALLLRGKPHRFGYTELSVWLAAQLDCLSGERQPKGWLRDPEAIGLLSCWTRGALRETAE